MAMSCDTWRAIAACPEGAGACAWGDTVQALAQQMGVGTGRSRAPAAACVRAAARGASAPERARGTAARRRRAPCAASWRAFWLRC